MTDPTEAKGVPSEQESDERKTLRGAWRLWRWWSRLTGWNDWGQWLWAIVQTKAGATIAIGAAGGVAALGTVAVVQPELLQGWLLPAPPAVEVRTERWAEDTVVFPIEGVDKAGRRASFDVVVLTSRYAWARASADQLTRSGASLTPAEIADQVFRPEIREGLARSADLIAVGTASEEGDVATETTRADRRARSAARWIASAAKPTTRIWLLNLGQFRTSCAAQVSRGDTSWQRPFMMIGVRKQALDVVLGEALADAMAGKTNLPSPECYSNFQLVRLE